MILGTIEKEPHYSAGITLDHSDPDRLIMSRLIDGQFEIEIWTIKDGVLWVREQVSEVFGGRNKKLTTQPFRLHEIHHI